MLKTSSRHVLKTSPRRLEDQQMFSGLFHIQIAEFQPADTVKNSFTGAFQEFYTITRSSYSKDFIYLKSLKISCEEVIRNEVVTCQLASLWKELFHISTSPSCILLSFPKNASRSLLKKRLGKCASTISFRKYKRKLLLLVICQLNYNLSKSTSFYVEWGIWCCLEYSFCQINWNLLLYKDYKNIFLFSPCVFWCVLFDKKLIVLHHGNKTFLPKLTLSAIILTMEYW